MNQEVRRYFAKVPKIRAARLRALHELIVSLYPTAVADLAYKMPTYHVGDGWVAIANQKHHVSLYTCGFHHIEEFKCKHPRIRTGKGCINFKDSDELPLEAIEGVVKHAMTYPNS